MRAQLEFLSSRQEQFHSQSNVSLEYIMIVKTYVKLKEKYRKQFQETNLNTEELKYIPYIMMYTRTVLRTFGIWPTSDSEKLMSRQIYKVFIIFFTYFLIGFIMIGTLLNLILIEKSTHNRLKKSMLIFTSFIFIMKYSNLLIRRSQIKRCLSYLEDDWIKFTEARSLMIRYANVARRFTILNAILLYSSGIAQRVILPIHIRKLAIALNLSIRPLSYPIYLFSVDTQATPTYEILYIVYCVYGIVVLSINTATCGITLAFIVHGCSQVRILVNLMLSLVKKQWQNETDLAKNLVIFVEYQVRLRR